MKIKIKFTLATPAAVACLRRARSLLSFSMPLTFADHAPSTYSIKQNAKVVMTAK